MAIVKCKSCGEEIATTEKKCPSCGAKGPNAMSTSHAIIGMFVALAVIGALADNDSNKPAEQADNQQAEAAPKTEANTAKQETPALPDAEKAAIAANLETIAKALHENANNKQFIKSTGFKSIDIKANTENISSNNFGGLDITIYVAKELPQHKDAAKDFVDAVINKYKTDTNQDVIFNISAKLFADTKIDSVKHYYARAKYLPNINPTVEVEDKDHLVNVEL